MSSDEIIQAVQEALNRNPGVDIIYIHTDGREKAIAAIVLAGTPAYKGMNDAYPTLPPHDHLEPGMF